MKKSIVGYDIAIIVLTAILLVAVTNMIGDMFFKEDTIPRVVFDIITVIIVFGSVIFILLRLKKKNTND